MQEGPAHLDGRGDVEEITSVCSLLTPRDLRRHPCCFPLCVHVCTHVCMCACMSMHVCVYMYIGSHGPITPYLASEVRPTSTIECPTE